MTALHHLGHANEGTSIMAFEAHLNCQSPGNSYSELMGIFLEFASKRVFEIAERCKLQKGGGTQERTGFSFKAVSETSAGGNRFSRCRCLSWSLSKALKRKSNVDKKSWNLNGRGWCKPKPTISIVLIFSSLTWLLQETGFSAVVP